MEQEARLERPIRFAEFEVDSRAGELRRLGAKIKLQEQPFQVLAMLLEHPGDVVTREELQQRIWPGDTFVDFENGLNKAINKLRVALGDSVENPRFVETLPRYGYRFIATIDRVAEYQNGLEDAASRPVSTSPPPGGGPDATHATMSPPAQPMSERPAVSTAQRRLRLRWVAVLALASILVAVVGLNAGGLMYRLFGGLAAGRIRSIAVLPLETLSRDPDQEYFAEGMTEALITNLGKIGELRVISRTSVMRYKGTKKSVREIARELQVDALVEGTVTRSGDRVRITANLVQASPEKHLWADSFERDLRDVLALQDHVSQAIANGIRIKLTPKEQSRLLGRQPVDPEAIEAYLRGRYELSRSEFDQSIEHFEQALLKEPNYAQAWAGLAAAYDGLVYDSRKFGSKPPGGLAATKLNTQLLAKAKAAAIKALQLDESLSEAHVSLGQVLMDMDWSWGAAEKEFQGAIALDHSNALAHRAYGENLMAWGRLDEAAAELNRARMLDPFSWRTQVLLARTCSAAGRYDEALQHWREAFALGDPEGYHHHRRMAIAYEGKGMEQKAVAELVAATEAFAKEHGSRRLQGLATEVEQKYISSGYAEAKKAFLRGDIRALRDAWQMEGPIWIAEDYAELGENDEAFEWLNKTIQMNNPNKKFIKTDDRLKALRTDPRFQDLVRNLGFPPAPDDIGGSTARPPQP